MSGMANSLLGYDLTPQEQQVNRLFQLVMNNPVGTETISPQATMASPIQPVAFWGARPVSQGFRDMVDLGTNVAMGFVGGTNLPKSFASRAGFLYNAPDKLPRSFAEDYRFGSPPADASGRLTEDIEGRPLTADFIAGRRTVGGPDEAITPAQFDALAEKAIGRRPEIVASKEIGGDAGRFTRTAPDATSASGDAVYDIYTNRSLSERGRDLATGHELGHMVDELVGQIDPKGLQPELGRVYNTLTTGQERTRHLTRPSDLRYKEDDVPRELMATAIHAYLTNPNYLKTVAPKVAETIRAAVNANPRLKDIIQFNSIAGLTLGGAGVVGTQSQ